MNQMHFCEDRYLVEANLHDHFKRQRLHGEWFSLSLEDLLYIQHHITLYDKPYLSEVELAE